jgi:hypothetical protein
MRTNRTIRARWRRTLLLGWCQRKDLDRLLAPMSCPGATKHATCDITPSDWLSDAELRHKRERGRQQATKSIKATRTLSFGSRSQTLLPKGTSLAISRLSDGDRSLGKGVLLI